VRPPCARLRFAGRFDCSGAENSVEFFPEISRRELRTATGSNGRPDRRQDPPNGFAECVMTRDRTNQAPVVRGGAADSGELTARASKRSLKRCVRCFLQTTSGNFRSDYFV
jgi:hypothetical protein